VHNLFLLIPFLAQIFWSCPTWTIRGRREGEKGKETRGEGAGEQKGQERKGERGQETKDETVQERRTREAAEYC